MREAEQILGYSFLKPSLLEEALTHSSFSKLDTISSQQLELVGDAVLTLAMTNYLKLSHRDLTRGRISTLRSANLCTERLARVAVRHNIYPLVRRNSPELDKKVEEFTKTVMLESEDQIYGGITQKAPKVLADVVEAIAAAIYEDSSFNLDVMWEVVKRLLEPLVTPETFVEQPVTALHQLCQKNGKVVEFHTWRKGKTTNIDVLVDSKSVGFGSSEHKTIAKLNAARDALEKLNGEKSNLLIKSLPKEVEDEKEAKQKLNVLRMKRHWHPPPVHQCWRVKWPMKIDEGFKDDNEVSKFKLNLYVLFKLQFKNLCVGWVEVGRVGHGHGRVRQPTGMGMQEQAGAD
ncbi:ribonuclease 3-like protein 2-like isoform X2 [Carex littledalei]|uniref:Ribonuclease 3-like protein 2-like isoform X2 n=1 Tax=Carex littledalei TaxID=544730 RepID=A0A833VMP0_9POAL|nr:ribonuclease 3-like protein 2-like isoform X2 [Carex littledalei]